MPTKKELAEREEAREKLREIVKPGDVLKTILRHTSKSGMSRSISPVIDCEDVSYLVARAIGEKVDQNHGGIKVGGCGMDMGFALVNSLSYALYPEYRCTGRDGYGKDRCPSNEHVNPQRDPNTGERIGPPAKPDGKMMHKDGYALQQEWL